MIAILWFAFQRNVGSSLCFCLCLFVLVFVYAPEILKALIGCPLCSAASDVISKKQTFKIN